MRSRKLFLISALFFVIGLVSIWSRWNGSAGINAGDAIDAWAVSFNGSVHGWPAMIGVLAILAALVIFLYGLVRLLLDASS